MSDVHSLHKTPIPPLVLRHVQDAAWYWAQLEWDRFSPLIATERLHHYQTMFACHLEGAHFAGELGWEFAVKEWQRWKDPEQFFVCWHLALHDPDSEKTDWLCSLMDSVPDAADVVASALFWSGRQHIRVKPGQNLPPCARIAVLNACALYGDPPQMPLASLFETDDPSALAAACRLAGGLRREALSDMLLRTAQTPDIQVREQAGIALLLCQRPQEAHPLLREAMLHWHTLAETGEGGRALYAEHRAETLACVYGHALPDRADREKLATLPPHLLLLSLAHHGDMEAVDSLSKYMEDGSVYAPRALRSLSLISGLMPEDEGLCLPSVLPDDPGYDDSPNYPGRHLDSGLPSPDPDLIRGWVSTHRHLFPEGKRLLGGVAADVPVCLSVLEYGQQDQRFAASFHAARCSSCLQVDTIAPMTAQKARMRTLRTATENT